MLVQLDAIGGTWYTYRGVTLVIYHIKC